VNTKMVRYTRSTNDLCIIMGVYLKETELYVFYRTRNGKAYVSKSRVHMLPCPHCPDYEDD
jgi:hypothetical protein